MSITTFSDFCDNYTSRVGKRPSSLPEGHWFAYRAGKAVPFTNRLDALQFSDLVEYVEPSHEEIEVRNSQIYEYDNRRGLAYVQYIREEYGFLSNPQFEILFATAAAITGSKLNDEIAIVLRHLIDLVANPLIGTLRRVY